MEVDHRVPEAEGGITEEANLWLACSLCNDHKNDRIAALDPDTESVVRLFDPRHQVWGEHFRWSSEGDRILGLTPNRELPAVFHWPFGRTLRLGAAAGLRHRRNVGHPYKVLSDYAQGRWKQAARPSRRYEDFGRAVDRKSPRWGHRRAARQTPNNRAAIVPTTSLMEAVRPRTGVGPPRDLQQ